MPTSHGSPRADDPRPPVSYGTHTSTVSAILHALQVKCLAAPSVGGPASSQCRQPRQKRLASNIVSHTVYPYRIQLTLSAFVNLYNTDLACDIRIRYRINRYSRMISHTTSCVDLRHQIGYLTSRKIRYRTSDVRSRVRL
jgi:hypothetical protein